MSSDKKKKNEDQNTFIGLGSRDAPEKMRTQITGEQPLFETRDAPSKARSKPLQGTDDKQQ
jgi:hypothetical protein